MTDSKSWYAAERAAILGHAIGLALGAILLALSNHWFGARWWNHQTWDGSWWIIVGAAAWHAGRYSRQREVVKILRPDA